MGKKAVVWIVRELGGMKVQELQIARLKKHK